MMDAMLNVQLQLMQTMTQQRPEETESTSDQFRALMQERRDAAQAEPTVESEVQGEEQTTIPVQKDTLNHEEQVQEQMVLAAMAMMQNPVVYPQEMQVQQQAENTVQVLPFVAQQTQTQQVAAQTGSVLTPEVMQQAQGEFAPQTQSSPENTAVLTVVESEQPVQTDVQQPIEAVEHTDTEMNVEVKRQGQETDESVTVEAGAETPVFRNVREIPLKVGEAPASEEMVNTKSVESQIGEKLSEAVQLGETRVELQLTPEHLGRVQVEMTWNAEGALRVTIQAENSQTRSILERDTTNLLMALNRHTGEEVQVVVTAQSQESQSQQFQQEHHNGDGRQNQQQNQRNHDRDGQDFLQQLRLGLIPLEREVS